MRLGHTLCRVLLSAFLLAPLADLQAATINFAPLFFSESSDQGRSFSLLGPLVESCPEYTAVRPLFAADGSQTDVLYPLGRFTAERGRFIPLFSYTNEASREDFNLLLLFAGRYRDEGYGGLFPLYGTLNHRFGHDHIRFVLWPLYSRTTDDGLGTYSFLWPVFHYSPGRELKVFPLYGYEKTVNYRHDFALWPFIHFRRGAQHIDAVLPFYYHSSGETYRNWAVLWPLFTYSRDTSPEFSAANFPWPFLRRASGAYEELRIFPFYWSKSQGETYQRKIVLWPLYRHSTFNHPSGSASRERTTILLVGTKTTLKRENAPEERELTIWPLWHRHVRDDLESWYFPWIVPIHDEGFRRSWLPLLTLASRTETPEASEVSILWKTFLYRKEGRCSSFALSFLFSFERCPDSTKLGFFSDLVGWEWGSPRQDQ